MRIIVRPVVDPQREIDLTRCLLSAIAEELWQLYGGNAQLNWLEAELHLERIVGEERAEAREDEIVLVALPAGGAIPAETAAAATAPQPSRQEFHGPASTRRPGALSAGRARAVAGPFRRGEGRPRAVAVS